MNIGKLLSKPFNEFKDALTSKGHKDPWSRLAQVGDPMKYLGGPFEDISDFTHNLPSDTGNKIGAELLPNTGWGFFDNKPGSVIAPLVLGGIYGAGALGGGAGGGASAPTGGASGAGAGGTGTPTWAQYLMKYGGAMNQQNQQTQPQPQAEQTPPASQRPSYTPIQAPQINPYPRSRLETSMNPSIGQLLSNYGGGY